MLPETCRVVIPIKLEFSASVGFIHKESLTMHGHTIVKHFCRYFTHFIWGPQNITSQETEMLIFIEDIPMCLIIYRVNKLFIFLISSFRRVQNVVCFLLGDSPASDLYMPTFRNTLSVPFSKAGVHLPLKMEQIECSETSAYINQTPGNHPKENKQNFL